MKHVTQVLFLFTVSLCAMEKKDTHGIDCDINNQERCVIDSFVQYVRMGDLMLVQKYLTSEVTPALLTHCLDIKLIDVNMPISKSGGSWWDMCLKVGSAEHFAVVAQYLGKHNIRRALFDIIIHPRDNKAVYLKACLQNSRLPEKFSLKTDPLSEEDFFKYIANNSEVAQLLAPRLTENQKALLEKFAANKIVDNVHL